MWMLQEHLAPSETRSQNWIKRQFRGETKPSKHRFRSSGKIGCTFASETKRSFCKFTSLRVLSLLLFCGLVLKWTHHMTKTEYKLSFSHFRSASCCGLIFQCIYIKMGKGGERSAELAESWPGSADGMRDAFIHSKEDEPHVIRRKEILSKYPEIQKLYGNEWRVAPIATLLVVIQVAIAYYQKDWSNSFFFLVAWIYGGASSHALSLMTHELSHSLVFAERNWNDYFGIFCNIGMGVPSSTMFKRYHMEHHAFQGDSEKDADIPTRWEGRFFTNTFLKSIWLLMQPFFYALRPTVIRPKQPNTKDYLNTLVIVLSDLAIFHYCGLRGLLYVVLSSLLGMGFHPVAGHFIAEHYVFPGDKVETYSYYGALNYLCWNVGYHNEHHDFPRVPGWRLPEIRKIAPEYYNNLPQHKSWTYVLYKYVTDSNIGPFNRVIRGSTDKKI